MLTAVEKLVLASLRWVRDGNITGRSLGICYNYEFAPGFGELRREWGETVAGDKGAYVLTKIWRSWPYFSGSNTFPVPAGRSPLVRYRSTASAAFYMAADQWDELTEYGQLRRELLDFLIADLEARA